MEWEDPFAFHFQHRPVLRPHSAFSDKIRRKAGIREFPKHLASTAAKLTQRGTGTQRRCCFASERPASRDPTTLLRAFRSAGADYGVGLLVLASYRTHPVTGSTRAARVAINAAVGATNDTGRGRRRIRVSSPCHRRHSASALLAQWPCSQPCALLSTTLRRASSSACSACGASF